MNATISKNPLLLGGTGGATAPKTVEEVAKQITKPTQTVSENIWFEAIRAGVKVKDPNRNVDLRLEDLWSIQTRPDSWIKIETIPEDGRASFPSTKDGMVPVFGKLVNLIDGLTAAVSGTQTNHWFGTQQTPAQRSLRLQLALVQEVTITLMKEWVEAVDRVNKEVSDLNSKNYAANVQQQAKYNVDVAMATERLMAEAKAATAPTPAAESNDK